ncbi:retron Ec67 family RNA-directed DNA polymerase/endonuclease [Pseudomonas aeruginosa]|uniref:retron Ec67 family RNA-directed DNA polymerase/endonuclease n=1 Tax=Pseudomonas aeruginosa TaxID=287 RepID=UPI003EE09824
MRDLELLKSIKTRSELAVLLGYKPKALTYLLFKMPPEQRYKSFPVPKRSGGQRTINAPCPELKTLQKRLAGLLVNCSSELALAKKLPRISYGFNKGGSTLDNASVHRRRRYVLNVDLEDFFGSIHLGRVRGFFINNEDFKLLPDVATVIAQIACLDGKLPQGSPASPVISNIIGHILDVHLARLARRYGCSYSRYADDLTFSTNKPIFPQQIASLVDPLEHIWVAGGELEREITRCGFRVNHSKTRLEYNDSRQVVTGVVVNKKLNVPSEFKRGARAMADRLFKTGSFENVQVVELDGVKQFARTSGTINQLAGVFSYIYMVSHWNSKKLAIKPGTPLTSIERVHRDFLFYKDFYANQFPTILCEGKTDNTYLKCALKGLASSFPALIGRKPDGSPDYKIRFFRGSRLAARLLSLSGGTAQLKDFIAAYSSWCAKFKSQGGAKPVIIVIDNDAGATHIYNWYASVKRIPKPDGMLPYYYVGQNLYIVPTPKAAPADMSKIEDLFKADALGVILGGKRFNPNNDTENTTEYGKQYFADHVVKARQKTIDFSGFEPLLDTISKIILSHTTAVAAAAETSFAAAIEASTAVAPVAPPT